MSSRAEQAAGEEIDATPDSEETLEERVSELEETAQAALSIAQRAQRKEAETREQMAERIEELEREVAEQRDELEEVRDRTDLLQAAKNASALAVEERAAVVIQNAANQARDRDPQRATLNAKEGLTALGGGIDRTSVYDVFRKAEEIIGDDDVVWYQQESRGAAKNSRLIVDLENGELPSNVAGHDLSTGGE